MTLKWSVTVLVVGSLLAGCGGMRRCASTPDYQQARTLPPLQGVEGLKLPQSATPLVVPQAPSTGPLYEQVRIAEDGGERRECLDVPPRMEEAPVPPPAA